MNKTSLGSKELGIGGKRYRMLHKRNARPREDMMSLSLSMLLAAFKTIEEEDEHMDTGHHIMTPEKETIHNNVRRQWAAITTSYWRENWQDRLCSFSELTTEQKVGLKEAESCSDNIFGCKNLFIKGAKDLHQKAMPAELVEQIKKTFPVSEWVEAQTVRGYFSQLALQQKGLPVRRRG